MTIKDFKIRIANIYIENIFLGSGYLVNKTQILTCAHIIDKFYSVSTSKNQKLVVSFPFASNNAPSEAKIIYFNNNWKNSFDLAMLGIEDNRLGFSDEPLLVKADDYWGHQFRAIGFPKLYDDGVWVAGRVLSSNKAGLIQVEADSDHGYWFQPGFSGTPIWDINLNGVIGILASTELNQRIKTAFIVPTNEISKNITAISEYIIDAGDKKYYEMQAVVARKYQDSEYYRRRLYILESLLDTNFDKPKIKVDKQEISTSLFPVNLSVSFKNRSEEYKTLRDLVLSQDTLLISVEGVGGIGKSALVIKLLNELLASKEKVLFDGIIFLGREKGITLDKIFSELEHLLPSNDAKAIQNIALSKEGIPFKVSMFLNVLKKYKFLFVFDNFDDILTPRGDIQEKDIEVFLHQLAKTSQGSKIILTTRISPSINLEIIKIFRKIPIVDGLPTHDSQELFSELLKTISSGKEISDEEYDFMVDITKGIPRAIEIFSSILLSSPVLYLGKDIKVSPNISAEIVSSLVKENCSRLDDLSIKIIEAVSIFRRPISQYDIMELLDPFIAEINIIPLVNQLIRSYFVKMDLSSGLLFLHPIDQEFFYSRLVERSNVVKETKFNAIELHRRAAKIYQKKISDKKVAVKQIGDLESHIEQFHHLLAGKLYVDAFELLNGLERDFLYNWGYYSTALQMRLQIDSKDFSAERLFVQNSRLGSLSQAVANLENAKKFFQKALDISIGLCDKEKEAQSLNNLSQVFRANGDGVTALNYCKKALKIVREQNLLERERIYLGQMGLIYNMLGDFNLAIDYYSQALRLAENVNDAMAISNQLGNLGMTCLSFYTQPE